MFQNQREFYLQEQLRAINRELGQDDGDDLTEFEAESTERGLPEAVSTRARARDTEAPAHVADVAGGDRRSELPRLAAGDVLDGAHRRRPRCRARPARADEDHYGLEEVKDRILDFIAVLALVRRLEDRSSASSARRASARRRSAARSRAPSAASSSACRSAACATRRKSAATGGHMSARCPGGSFRRCVAPRSSIRSSCSTRSTSSGMDYRGDPAAALLEVLDPEQNRAFTDHYLEVDYDLSQVLFITTANSLSTIPDPLRDRMEVIRLSGYLDHEKLAIAEQFLIPRQLARNGLEPADVTLVACVFPAIVRGYTREAGVRELDRRLARVARKLARRKTRPARCRAAPILADRPPRSPRAGTIRSRRSHDRGRDRRRARAGVHDRSGARRSTSRSASCAAVGRLQLDGHAWRCHERVRHAPRRATRARRAKALGIDRDFYRTRDIHVHIPAGATPKDGPSAGIAIATAIVSALSADAGARRHGHDRRDHAPRSRAADRRTQGKVGRGAPPGDSPPGHTARQCPRDQ